MDLFTLCGSGNGCGKIFCIDIVCYFATAAAAQYEHFSPIAAKKDIKTRCRCRTVWMDLNLELLISF